MNKLAFSLLGILAVIAIGVWPIMPSQADDEPAEAAAPKPVAVVTAAAARSVSWPQVIEAQGAIAPWQEAVVSARVSGLTLVDISANVGDAVQRDEVLAQFDARTVQVDITQATANLAQAAATHKQARQDRDRLLKLGKSSAVSEQDMVQAVTTAETAAAQEASAAASLKALEIRLEDTQILAPDDGVITSRDAVLGQVPQPGSELFRMIRQNRLEWRAQLNPRQFAAVIAGISAEITLPDGSSTTGTLRQLAGDLNSQTRLGLAYVDLDDNSTARSGMFASGRLLLANAPAIAVPAACIVIRDGRSLLFQLDGNRVTQRIVQTGRREDQLIEILSGVTPGDLLVLKGAGFLNDGDLVKVVEESGN
ncbi:MAG: efflux RND transporter periplasmic adaptor subunit [Lysobacterales bacterium]